MMPSFNAKETGKQAEDQTCGFLQAKGLRLVEKNYRCFQGEIDLIMQDNDIIVFIEVRHRNRTDFGSAVDTITKTKQRKLIKAATHFLQKKKWLFTRHSRFDVVAIHPIDGVMRLEWIKNAFSGI